MLLVARHGETEWNRDGRMQGRLGGPLTARGRAQAAALAEAARALGVRQVVASPLPRAAWTAGLVATTLALPLRLDEALVETDFGACGGLTEAEIAARWPDLRAERERDKWHHRWPGGESYADLAARLRGLGPLEDGTLVVAHQSLNRALVHAVAGAPIAAVLAMAQPSDVLIRLRPDVAHARFPGLDWRPGLGANAPRLN